MNDPSRAALIVLVTFGAVALMLYLVLRPLMRQVRGKGQLRLIWFVVGVLLVLLGLAQALGRAKKLLP